MNIKGQKAIVTIINNHNEGYNFIQTTLVVPVGNSL